MINLVFNNHDREYIKYSISLWLYIYIYIYIYIYTRIYVITQSSLYVYHHAGNIPLVISTHPQNQTTVLGSQVTFTCNATGDPPISYQWFYNNVAIPSTNTTMYTINFVGFDDFGSYHCNATSGSDEVASNSATLTGMNVFKFYTICFDG